MLKSVSGIKKALKSFNLKVFINRRKTKYSTITGSHCREERLPTNWEETPVKLQLKEKKFNKTPLRQYILEPTFELDQQRSDSHDKNEVIS